jgi:hypothetical protein
MQVAHLLVLVLALQLLLVPSAGSAQVYGLPHPVVFKYNFNFTIVDILVLNSTHIALAVNYKQHSAIVVADLRDPISGARLVQTYPLSGRITAFSTDGFPPSRLAVGSDRGEIYLFKIDGGRLYQLLHLIQGADFRVISLFVARAAGSYKLIATVSEGQPLGLCVNCYVYVFDENQLGALVISPHKSSTTFTCGKYVDSRIYPQMAIPAKVYTASGYYYRADSIALFWAPYIESIIVNLSVLRLVNATLVEPAKGALIEVNLLDPVTRTRRVYGWNADSSGVALIPVPRGYIANITVVGISQKYLAVKNVNTSAIVKSLKTETIIPESASTDLAEDVYGPPFFAKYYVDFLDLSNAPSSCRVVGSLEKSLYPAVSTPHFVDYGGGYLIALTNRTFLELYNLDYAYRLNPDRGVGFEYVGAAKVSIVDVIAYSKSDIVVGLSDGRIKHYRFNELKNSYEFAQALVTLGSLIRIQPLSAMSYFTFSAGGIQVVSLAPFQLPLLRVGFEAEFSVENLVSAYSLPTAELVALASSNSVYAIVNLGPSMTRPAPINLANYVAPSLVLKLLPPAPQEQVNGSKVILKYEIGGMKKEIARTYIGDNITFTNIVPGSNYSIEVVPPKDYMLGYTTSVEIPYCAERCKNVELSARIEYRDFAFGLMLEDEYGEPLLGRLIVDVDGKTYEYRSREGLKLRLLYGAHEVCAKSLDGYYMDFCTLVNVVNDTLLRVPLVRSQYNMTIMFIDKMTKRAVEPKLAVYINGIAHAPSQDSKLVTTVKAGWINITVVPVQELTKVFSSYSTRVIVNRSMTLEVPLDRVVYEIYLSALDEVTRRAISLLSSVRINGTEAYRGLLPAVLRLPYAYYSIELVPVEEYERVYEPSVAELLLDSSKSLSVLILRKVYLLEMSLKDRYSEKPVVPLRVLINGSQYSVVTSPTLALPLRAANYVIRIEPIEGYTASYEPIERSISLFSNAKLSLDLKRYNYTLTLVLRDTSVRGYLEGRFRVSLNTTVVTLIDGSTASRGINMSVPYGKYVLTIVPVDVAEKLYSSPQPTTINIISNTSYTARLNRKVYSVVLTAVNDLDERLDNAYAEVTDPATGISIASLYTDEKGEIRLSMPAGALFIRVTKGGYQEYTEALYLDKDSTITARLNPTLTTLVGRFTHVIALAVVATAVILITLKLRAKLVERLRGPEEVF